MEDLMDIDGPEFINHVNAQIATIRSGGLDRPVDLSLFSMESKDSQTFTTIAIVDTNFLISNLAYLRTLLEAAEKNPGSLLILIPWVVIRELDGLKGRRSSLSSESVDTLARKAMKFLETQLQEKSKYLKGQKLHETRIDRSLQDPKLKGDDLILDCCIYFQSITHQNIYLLSNDRNLCIKVMIHDIQSLSAESKTKMGHFIKAVSNNRFLPQSRPIAQPIAQRPLQPSLEEDSGMDIDDEGYAFEATEDMAMVMDYDAHFRSGTSESRWAKEPPLLVAPRRPTPPPLDLTPPAFATDKKSTWASIHAPKYL
ncbi:PIN domain-containing protein [Sporodiniella umbellata]|nr:PIN domain-containing protein [Sporodiniella umbellata]